MFLKHPIIEVKEMASHSSTLALRIPWTEEPGRLQSMGSQRVGHELSDFTSLTDRIMLEQLRDVNSLKMSFWGWGQRNSEVALMGTGKETDSRHRGRLSMLGSSKKTEKGD